MVPFLFVSFSNNEACNHVGSTIVSVGNEIQKALEANNMNHRKYFTYKSLNTIERSRRLLDYCNCSATSTNLLESLENLKDASRATSLGRSKALLENALMGTEKAMEVLRGHNFHKSKYANDILTLNTKKEMMGKNGEDYREVHLKRIDSSLAKYQNSLDKVVNTVECEKALAYVRNVLDLCDKQLLRPRLSEARLHYYLRTKEITKNALDKLNGCSDL
jgi:hypothetical protein